MAARRLRLGHPAQLRSGWSFDSGELETDHRTPVAGRLSVVRWNSRAESLAMLDGKVQTAEFFERRFRDEYRPAFAAWLGTDPFKNAQAPPGPIFMPEYHNAKHEQFLSLNKQAAEVADQGTKSGENGDEYVRITVLLATVLLITAIGQRFHFKTVRLVFMVLACLLLCLPLLQLLMLPRI